MNVKIYACLVIVLLIFTVSATKKESNPRSGLPIVKLKNRMSYRPILMNSDSIPLYRFKGIRYGEASQRFSPPESVKKSRKKGRVIDSGKVGSFKCPQAHPGWLDENHSIVRATSEGASIRSFGQQRNNSGNPALVDLPPDEIEDCLFMDITVPKSLWDRAHAHPEQGFSLVIVWIHSSGFVSGDKNFHTDPEALLSQSLEVNENGAILVFINYRLGIFGFLSGNDDLISNVGLLDQRAALNWIRQNIEKFGGDKFRVTVVGEDAGAASILHHITAPKISQKMFPKSHHFVGDNSRSPFRSAILKSPAFQPLVQSQSRLTFEKVLDYASTISGHKIDSVSGLRRLPFKTLYAINTAIVHGSPVGTFTFGPAIDYGKNSYVPDFPLRSLDSGLGNQDVNVFIGRTNNEGIQFDLTAGASEKGFRTLLATIFPTVARRDIDFIVENLYSDYDYANGGINRSTEALADVLVNCNVHYLVRKMKNSFGFVVNDASTGEDYSLDRMFFSHESSPVSSQGKILESFQKKLLLFAMFSLQGAQSAGLKSYQSSGEVMLVSNDTIQGYLNDTIVKEKHCKYWAGSTYEMASLKRRR